MLRKKDKKLEELIQLVQFKRISTLYKKIRNQKRNLGKVMNNQSSQKESLFSKKYCKITKYTKIRKLLGILWEEKIDKPIHIKLFKFPYQIF